MLYMWSLFLMVFFFFSQEEYLDFRSFEVRIESTLKQLFSQRGRPNPSSSATMMVQTPGVSHGWGQSYPATPMVNMSNFNNSNNLSDASNRMNGGNISQRDLI